MSIPEQPAAFVRPERSGLVYWPDPEPWMLDDPLFNSIWQIIKSWDISVPGAYNGYCAATGNHARALFDALIRPSARPDPEFLEWLREYAPLTMASWEQQYRRAKSAKTPSTATEAAADGLGKDQ
jgi:hypothetical protein